MSVISLADIKADLHITADDQDDYLQRLLDAAEDEAARFMNRTQLATLPVDYPESEDVSEDVPQDTDPLAPERGHRRLFPGAVPIRDGDTG